MLDSEKRPKHAAKGPVIEPKPDPELDDAFIDDFDAEGNEGEIPLRLKKKAPKKSKKTHSKARKKKSKQAKNFSEKRFQKKKSLFDLMSASGEDSFFKPLRIFGHEIRFWPLILLAFLVMLVAVIIMSNGSVSSVKESITVVGLPEELEDYNILVISDMNGKRFGDKQSALVREVESHDYDVILCVGDMVGEGGDPEPFYEFLEGINRASRVYFVCGDSDPGPFLESPRNIQGTLEQLVLEDWILGAIERGANYVDVPMSIEVGEGRFWLTPTNYLNLNASEYREMWKDQMRQEEDGVVTGLASDYKSLPFTSYRYAQAEKFYQAVNTITPSDMLIGLSHIVPSDDLIQSASMHDNQPGYLFEPELIISGHYCGGVWKIPFAGAIYVPNRMLPRYGWFPAKEDVNGASKVGESQVYLTAGLSTTDAIPLLPFRVFNDPEISLLTLTAKLPDNMLEAA